MLHVLHRLRRELGITLCAASIDHGLRPESAAEVEQVRRLADSLGVPFVSARVDIQAEGASLQAKARDLRYRALHELAKSRSAKCIAVGHTQDDQAETVIARVLRGAGIRGLSGIEPKRADGVIRPLFDCRRQDVHAYAVARGLPFVEDPSNHQRSFERVRVRQQLLPVLVAEDPRLIEHLCALSDEAAELNAYLDSLAPELPPVGDRFAPLSRFAGLPAPLRIRWLRSWIARETGLTLGRSHLTDLNRLVMGPGELLLGSGWSVRREAGGLSLDYREHRRTRSSRP
jgi:tRNA(Ile)-lysidine synthase